MSSGRRKGTAVHYILAEQALGAYENGPVRVQPGDVVLDCGANVGDFAGYALRAGALRVVAIEPSREAVECLRRNFGSDPRVTVYPRGVWHEATTLRFWTYENSALDSAVMDKRTESHASPKQVSIDVTTIDRIVDELQLPRVDFVKMDIEGAERQALKGAARTISRFRPRMAIATENLPDDYVEVPKAVRGITEAYRVSHKCCGYLQNDWIRPSIMFFETR